MTGVTKTGGGLLMELAVPPNGAGEPFAQWHDTERVPWRRKSAAVVSGGTYQQLGVPDEWLAVYDLSDPGGVSLEHGSLLPESSELMLARLPRFEQRRYEQLEVPEVARAPRESEGALLMAVWWTPLPGQEEDFQGWYNEEHIRMLMDVPGWLCIRRYRLVEGTGPAYVALHYLASAESLSGPEHAAAGATPWRARSAGFRVQHERRVYQLRQRF